MRTVAKVLFVGGLLMICMTPLAAAWQAYIPDAVNGIDAFCDTLAAWLTCGGLAAGAASTIVGARLLDRCKWGCRGCAHREREIERLRQALLAPMDDGRRP